MENLDDVKDVEAGLKTMQPAKESGATTANANIDCSAATTLKQDKTTPIDQVLLNGVTIQSTEPRSPQRENQLANNDKERVNQLRAAINRRRATTFADYMPNRLDTSASDFVINNTKNVDESRVANSGIRKSALKGNGTSYYVANSESAVNEQQCKGNDADEEESDEKHSNKRKRPVHRVEKDSRKAWLTIASTCFVAYGTLYGTTYTFPVLYTALERRFSNGSEANAHIELLSFRISWIGAACFGMSNFLCVFSGMLTELISTQLLLLIGALAGALGILASAFVERLEMWYITYVCITGLGNACIYLAVVTALSEHFERHFSLANGITSLGSGVMQTVFPFIWQYLLHTYGLSEMLYFMAACYASLALFVPLWRTPGSRSWFSVRRYPRIDEDMSDDEESNNEVSRSRSAEELSRTTCAGEQNGFDQTAKLNSSSKSRNLSSSIFGDGFVGSRKAHKLSEGDSEPVDARGVAARTIHASLLQLPNAAARRMRADMQRNAELSPLTKPLSVSLITSLSSSSSGSVESGDAKCDWCKLALFRNKRYVIFLLGMMFYEVGTAAPDMFIVSYTDAKFQTSGMGSLVPLISYSITMCVAKIAFSKLLGSFTNNLAISMWVFQLGPCLNGITMSLIPIFVSRMNSYPLMVLTCVLWGFSDGPPDALLAPVIRLLVGPELTARAVGYCVAICMTSSMLGPPLAGLILDTLRTYDITFCISGTLIFFGTCIFFLVNFIKDDPIPSSSPATECEPDLGTLEQSQSLLGHCTDDSTKIRVVQDEPAPDIPTDYCETDGLNAQTVPISPFTGTALQSAAGLAMLHSSSSSAYSTATAPSCLADTVC